MKDRRCGLGCARLEVYAEITSSRILGKCAETGRKVKRGQRCTDKGEAPQYHSRDKAVTRYLIFSQRHRRSGP